MKVRKTLVSICAALMVVAGAFVISPAQQAEAAPKRFYLRWNFIYPYKVCQHQGHWGASYTNAKNPYSWYCYDLSFPVGITWAGGLNMNAYCKAKYNGWAEVDRNHGVWGWNCVHRVYY